MANYDTDTSIIVTKLYPKIAASLDKSTATYKKVIADFINRNYDSLYAPAPYDIIYFNQSNIDALFAALHITEQEVNEIMQDCWYWNIPYNPQCAKEPYVVTLMCCLRYFLIKNHSKDAEITCIFLALSGKFYASLFGMLFPKAYPIRYKECMDYVINNMLTGKFSLRTEKHVFGAVRALCITFIETYRKDIVGKPTDNEVGKLIQQLRDREKSFLKNISDLYYQAYDNKLYMQYYTDNLEDGAEFRITDNDALRAARYTENAIQYIVNTEVSLDICNKCKDQNIKPTEIKNIMESIFSNPNNLDQVRRVINILICDFMRRYPAKSVSSVEFISYSIKAKPNIKDQYVIEMRDTILRWLDENSENYRKRKSRKATQQSYYKAVLLYLVLVINKVAR